MDVEGADKRNSLNEPIDALIDKSVRSFTVLKSVALPALGMK